MALSDTLTGIVQNSPAARCRVETLLERLEGTPDHEVLMAALRNKDIRAVDLTKALRIEYKDSTVVRDSSVSDWRRKHLREVDGL